MVKIKSHGKTETYTKSQESCDDKPNVQSDKVNKSVRKAAAQL